MTIVLIVVAWMLGLVLFVALKARQPKWDYPTPPAQELPSSGYRAYDAA
jgi:hypothetical protein